MHAEIFETDRVSIIQHGYSSTNQELQSSLLLDDFYQSIVPVHGKKLENVECSITPFNQDLERQLIELLPRYPNYLGRYNNTFKEAVLESITFSAHHIVYHGHLVMELVTSTDIYGKKHYALEGIYDDNLQISEHNIEQHVNKSSEAGVAYEVVNIPREKCYIIEFPQSLGGKGKYLNYIQQSKEFARKTSLLNYFRNPLSEVEGYNYIEHQTIQDLELWRKSKQYNLKPRVYNNRLFSSYYAFYRHLLLKKSQIVLRDHIISHLNDIIRNVSQKITSETELIVNGLVSLERINNALIEWETGEFDIKTIDDL